MTKVEINTILNKNYSDFLEAITSYNEEAFLYAPSGKWNAGQQLSHLIKSVAPVNLALSIPLFLLKSGFGTSNRPSKKKDELVEKYQLKLAQGGKAPAAFIPALVPFKKRALMVNKLHKQILSVSKKLDKLSEEELDKFLLPHPLLGKLTLREMFYFTAYHAQHHHNQMKLVLAKWKK
jgi:DinB superfamily